MGQPVLTFFVNADCDRVKEWLVHYAPDTLGHLRVFPPHNKKEISTGRARPCRGGYMVRLDGIGIQLGFIESDASDIPAEMVCPLRSAVTLQLVPLTTDRTEVRVRDRRSSGDIHLLGLLDDVARRWPESQEAISEYFRHTLHLVLNFQPDGSAKWAPRIPEPPNSRTPEPLGGWIRTFAITRTDSGWTILRIPEHAAKDELAVLRSNESLTDDGMAGPLVRPRRVQFTVDVGEEFVRKVVSHLLADLPNRIEVNDGFVVLLGGLNEICSLGTERILWTYCDVVIMDGVEKRCMLGPLFVIRLLSASPQRTHVALEHEITAFTPYLVGLLTKMADYWPQNRQGILECINEISGESWTAAPQASNETPSVVANSHNVPGCKTWAPKCVRWRQSLRKELMVWPEGEDITQERMADRLILSHDYVRQQSSEHRACCGFDWIRDVKRRGLLQSE